MKQLEKTKREYKILMVGLDAAGKTTILHQLKLGHPETTIPTIGFNVESVTYKEKISFTVWDIGGQDKIRPLWKHDFPSTQAVIFVVDSNDDARFNEAKKELHGMLADPALQNVVLLVLANKQDLPQARRAAEITDKLGLHELKGRTKDQDWLLQECSASTGRGIDTGLDWLATALAKRKWGDEEAAQ